MARRLLWDQAEAPAVAVATSRHDEGASATAFAH
jgi:hypothetical protein